MQQMVYCVKESFTISLQLDLVIYGYLFFNFFFGELVVKTNIARDVQDTLESFFELFDPLIEVTSKVIEPILQF